MLEVIGTIFIIVIGCISHFLYDWSNHNKIIVYFTAVNESTAPQENFLQKDPITNKYGIKGHYDAKK